LPRDHGCHQPALASTAQLCRLARARYRIGAVLFHFRFESSSRGATPREIVAFAALLVGRRPIDYATPLRPARLALPTRPEFATSAALR
jgi:hypothetical protein